MPTELEAMLKKEMCYKILAPTCINCEHSYGERTGDVHRILCKLNRVLAIQTTVNATCKFHEEKDVPF